MTFEVITLPLRRELLKIVQNLLYRAWTGRGRVYILYTRNENVTVYYACM
jgi:hypothetical protein